MWTSEITDERKSHRCEGQIRRSINCGMRDSFPYSCYVDSLQQSQSQLSIYPSLHFSLNHVNYLHSSFSCYSCSDHFVPTDPCRSGLHYHTAVTATETVAAGTKYTRTTNIQATKSTVQLTSRSFMEEYNFMVSILGIQFEDQHLHGPRTLRTADYGLYRPSAQHVVPLNKAF